MKALFCKKKHMLLAFLLVLAAVFSAFTLTSSAAVGPISEVSLTVNGYEIGANIADITVTINTPGAVFATQGNINAFAIKASDSYSGENLTDGTVQRNTEYFIFIAMDVNSAQGYSWDSKTVSLSATANGATLDKDGMPRLTGIWSDATGGYTKLYQCFKLPALSNDRSITVASGAEGDIRVEQNYTEITAAEPGSTVTIRLIQPDDPERAIRGVNIVTEGSSPVLSKQYSDSTGAVTFTMPDENVTVSVEYGTAITYFCVDIENFTVGNKLSDLTLTAVEEPNITVTVKEVSFANPKDDTFGVVDGNTLFTANTLYMFTLSLTADAGYALRPELYSDTFWNITVNGMSVPAGMVSTKGIAFDGKLEVSVVLCPENDALDAPPDAASALNGMYEGGFFENVTVDVTEPYSVEANDWRIYYDGTPVGGGFIPGDSSYDIVVKYDVSLLAFTSYDFSKLEANMFELGGESASYIAFVDDGSGFCIMAYYEMPELPLEAYLNAGERLVIFFNPFGQTEYATVAVGGTVIPPEVEYYGFRHVWYNKETGEKADFSAPITEHTRFEAVWYYDDIVLHLDGYEIGANASGLTLTAEHPHAFMPYLKQGCFLVEDSYVEAGREALEAAMALFASVDPSQWGAPEYEAIIAAYNAAMERIINNSKTGTLEAGKTYWLLAVADITPTSFYKDFDPYLVHEMFWQGSIGMSVDGIGHTDVLTSVLGDGAMMLLELEPLVIPTYTVTLPTHVGYTIVPEDGSATTVEEGGSFSFQIQVSAGYTMLPGFQVKVGGTTLTAVDGVYTIPSITENVSVSIDDPIRQMLVVGGVEMQDGDYLAVGASATTKTKPASGGYAYFTDGTLILSNYNNNGAYAEALDSDVALFSSLADALCIELVGESTLSCTTAKGVGIAALGSLYLEGDGAVTISATNYGINTVKKVDVYSDSLKISGAMYGIVGIEGVEIYCDVTISGGAGGIMSQGDIEFRGGNTVISATNGGIASIGGDIIVWRGALDITTEGMGMGAGSGNVYIHGGTLDIKSTGTGAADAERYAFESAPVIRSGLRVQAATEADGTLEEYLAASNASYDRIVITSPALWIGGVPLFEGEYLATGSTVAKTTKPARGGYAHYADGILTLNDYRYLGTGYEYQSGCYAVIYSPYGEDVTILLEGENDLEQTTYTEGYYAYALYWASGYVTVSGEGSLAIKSAGDGIKSEDDLTISGCTVTVEAEHGGIGVWWSMLVRNATLRINAEWACYAEEISFENSNITVVCGEEGICTEGDITVIGGTLSVTAGGLAIYADGDILLNAEIIVVSEMSGIFAYGTVTVAGGTLDVRSTATEDDLDYCAINVAPTLGTGLVISASTEADGALGAYAEANNGIYDRIVIVAAPKTYAVTLPTGTGYTVSAAPGSSSPVTEGGSFSFVLSIDTGYTKGTGFVVKVNGTPITEEDGSYTITNITADQVITVEGVTAVTPAPGTSEPAPDDEPEGEPTPDPITPPSGEDDGLSGGAIAGIVIGSTATAGIGGFAIFWFVIKKKSWAQLLAIFARK